MEEQIKMEKKSATQYMRAQKSRDCHPPMAENVFGFIGIWILVFKGYDYGSIFINGHSFLPSMAPVLIYLKISRKSLVLQAQNHSKMPCHWLRSPGKIAT